MCTLGTGEGRTLEGKGMGKKSIDTSIISQAEVGSHGFVSLICIFKKVIP